MRYSQTGVIACAWAAAGQIATRTATRQNAAEWRSDGFWRDRTRVTGADAGRELVASSCDKGMGRVACFRWRSGNSAGFRLAVIRKDALKDVFIGSCICVLRVSVGL